jgi:ribonuclease Z
VAEADVLVIESTFLDEDADAAARFGHITAAQAAALARDMGVRALILTHLSRRYREARVIEEARSVFANSFVARDLDHYLVRRDKPLEKLTREDTRARNVQPAAERDDAGDEA